MEDIRITFETAKLAKRKGFDVDCLNFYTNPNSKMFGLDEQNRPYHIKNTPKKIYTVGKEAALNIKNVILAPTQSLLAKWLREKYNLYTESQMYIEEGLYKFKYDIKSDFEYDLIILKEKYNFSTYEEALEIGLQEALKLI